jgi:hypothetical protein
MINGKGAGASIPIRDEPQSSASTATAPPSPSSSQPTLSKILLEYEREQQQFDEGLPHSMAHLDPRVDTTHPDYELYQMLRNGLRQRFENSKHERRFSSSK